MEEKIIAIINQCFGELREVFEENEKELEYDIQTYVEELIMNEFNK